MPKLAKELDRSDLFRSLRKVTHGLFWFAILCIGAYHSNPREWFFFILYSGSAYFGFLMSLLILSAFSIKIAQRTTALARLARRLNRSDLIYGLGQVAYGLLWFVGFCIGVMLVIQILSPIQQELFFSVLWYGSTIEILILTTISVSKSRLFPLSRN